MKKEAILIVFFMFVFLLFSVSAATISDDLHLNIQTINSSDDVVTGTFAFAFNISNSSGCEVANVTYSNLTGLTTDDRGIISYYLPNVTLNFNTQYWLCYYRNETLEEAVKIAKSPYSFNTTLSGARVDSNLNLSTYSIFSQNKNLSIGYDYSTNGTLISWLNALNGTLAINSTIADFVTNTNTSMKNYADANFVTLGGDTITGTYNFNGGWQSSGLTIQNGDIYAQTGFFYNITSLSINNLAINGSIIPQPGWDNVFDIGNSTRRWNDLALGGNAYINGSLFVDTNVTLGTNSADIITANGYFNSHLLPWDNSKDLGSASNRWQVVYADQISANNLSAGNASIAGTTFQTFSIYTNNTGNDLNNISLAFERGTPSINAVIKWDNVSQRFDFNFPINIQPDNNFTVDTNTFFINGNNNRVGIGTASPQNTLNVIGDINATTSIFSQNKNLSIGYDFATNGSFIAWSTAYNGTLAKTDAANTFGNFNQTFNGTTLSIWSLTNRVGIGTTSPTQTFSVIGTLNISNVSNFPVITTAAGGNISIERPVNHTLTGVVRTFANGCYELSNSTGLYWIC